MRKKHVNPAAQALGKLGGLATKGISTDKKKAAGRINAAVAREALAKKRANAKLQDVESK
jgi:hypothetical protein